MARAGPCRRLRKRTARAAPPAIPAATQTQRRHARPATSAPGCSAPDTAQQQSRTRLLPIPSPSCITPSTCGTFATLETGSLHGKYPLSLLLVFLVVEPAWSVVTRGCWIPKHDHRRFIQTPFTALSASGHRTGLQSPIYRSYLSCTLSFCCAWLARPDEREEANLHICCSLEESPPVHPSTKENHASPYASDPSQG